MRFVFEHQLTPFDWQQIDEFQEILRLFRDDTLKLEGCPNEQKKEPPIMLVSVILNSMMDALESLKDLVLQTYGRTGIYVGVEQAWNKARKYYNTIIDSPLYAAAMIFNPHWKLGACATLWDQNSADDQLVRLRRLVLSNYRDIHTNIENPPTPVDISGPAQISEYGTFDSAINRLGKRSTTTGRVDDEILRI